MDWIKAQRSDMMLTRSINGNNVIPQQTTQFQSIGNANKSIRDLISSKTKGVPKKLVKEKPTWVKTKDI